MNSCNGSALEFEPGLASAISQRRHSAVILVSTTIKNNRRYTTIDRPFAQKLSNKFGRFGVAASLDLAFQLFVERGRRHYGPGSIIIH